MAQNLQSENQNGNLGEWVLVILALVFFWPVGLVLLFRKLASAGTSRTPVHPYDIQRARETAEARGAARPARTEASPSSRRGRKGKVSIPSGKGLTLAGAILSAVFALGSVSLISNAFLTASLPHMITPIFACLGFLGCGIVMMAAGAQRSRKAKRFRKYLALIGRQDYISVEDLARAMPVSRSRAFDDLQEMLDKGYIPTGYLNYATGMLVISDEGLKKEEFRKQQQQQQQRPPEPAPAGMEREDAILREIRQLNDDIANPDLSRKIDRVGEITGRIFAYLREHPSQESKLRTFLNYYLPTTLKILRAYAQMESQGVEGPNIAAAKARIEGMMDQVVNGFEKQLDLLFQDAVLDITSDVAVLEQMLRRDGLSGEEGQQLGL